MAAGYVVENTIYFLKNRSEAVPTFYDLIDQLPDLTRSQMLCQKLRKGCPMSYAKFQRDPLNGSTVRSEIMARCIVEKLSVQSAFECSVSKAV